MGHTNALIFQNKYVKCTHIYSDIQVQEAGMNVLRDKLLGTTRLFPTISYSLVHSRLEQSQLARGSVETPFSSALSLGLVVTWSCSTSFLRC